MKSRLVILLLSWQTISMAQPTGVIQIPLVVHVLYNTSADSISAELIQTIILDSVNADFRRQNLDAIYTQTAYLPIAADTEIEFRFADTDPSGNPTTGINYHHTEVPQFIWYFGRDMMYDSLGGKDPWDECRYLNLWICNLNSSVEYENQWNGESPQGVVYSGPVLRFGTSYKTYRFLTHTLGHFLGLSSFLPYQCVDTDGISDTPIQSDFPNPAMAAVNPDSIFEETICAPLPNGRLANNFMTYTNPGFMKHMNMFTLGQKERMQNFISEHFPGYIDPVVSCLTGIEDRLEQLEFAIYPNPSTGNVMISFDQTNDREVVVMLFDIAGRIVLNQQMSTANSAELNLNLPSGIYIVHITDENSFHTEKLIIQ